MNDNINRGRRNMCGSMTADGTLYLTAMTKTHSADIFRSTLTNGIYSATERPAGINSSEPDLSPFVAPDGSYMILSSFHGAFGRSDLFVSFRLNDSTWSQPKNMGPRINSAYKDEYPYVTPDGHYLFFNSNRPSPLNPSPIEDGPGNIYWVTTSIIKDLEKTHADQR
jgi:hypothetical protein